MSEAPSEKDYHLTRTKAALLQKFLFSGQTVRDDRFGGQQQHAGEEQIPPQRLPFLGVFPRQRFGGGGFRRLGGRVAGHRRDELGRIQRGEGGLAPVEV